MKRWTYTTSPPGVHAVECPKVGYPNPDVHGATQYENTHFDSEEKAWAKLLSECEAGVSLGARARARLREQLDDVTRELADDAETLVMAKRLHAEWRATQAPSAAPKGDE